MLPFYISTITTKLSNGDIVVILLLCPFGLGIRRSDTLNSVKHERITPPYCHKDYTKIYVQLTQSLHLENFRKKKVRLRKKRAKIDSRAG